MYCRNCGELLQETAKFCKSCGSPVAKEESVNSNYDENRIGEERTITRVFSNADDFSAHLLFQFPKYHAELRRF